MKDTETLSCAVIYRGESLPKKPKVSLIDWIYFYVYNFIRKPFVWRKQKELNRIFDRVKYSLDVEVMSQLYCFMINCETCRNAYMALKPQIFLSQIQMILIKMACSEHWTLFADFMKKHQDEFDRSEKIARWINGFNK